MILASNHSGLANGFAAPRIGAVRPLGGGQPGAPADDGQCSSTVLTLERPGPPGG